ncbi:putative bifunctional diguanylate cyclase/phosphodiesterase [Tropicibacter naphthalenivorans]|uniref:Cyclic di-GMP phosphodiesterase Gmr n=1 Tax=Tropicibacter naphthalenivorans TaxID=441103 RepID=A0A0P1GGV8_9RHOB|nr:bifunctional diguanylate cyclase/phosphodiesterase [Tropicibacter naphthalenivorans]CUH80882.1 Cyclic di-GMP phosphodiesterase Gmr [Tropicibacter naphthalenivorans]SMC90775.1 diguanylate cyclase/phosphodiesterase [Tropicibacter naphthalenivorans]
MARFIPYFPERLWQRYVWALAVMAAMVVGNVVVQRVTFEQAAQNAARVLLITEQQTRVAQILSDLQTFEQSGDAPDLTARLDAFDAAQGQLLQAAPSDPAIQALAAAGEQFSWRVQSALVDPQADAPRDLAPTLAAVREDALRQAERQQAQAVRWHWAAFAVSGLVVIALAVLVFWPSHQSIRAATHRGRVQIRALQDKNDDLRQLSERLDHAKYHDALTGLGNRRKLMADLSRRMQAAPLGALCLLQIDLDRFKSVNDTLGVTMGDAVLVHVAKVLEHLLRTQDVIARVGGDEFVVIMEFPPEDAPEMARNLADAMLQAIRRPFSPQEDQTCTVAASIGYAFNGTRRDTTETIMANADIALGEAKQGGRGLALRYDAAMRAGLEWRATLIADLERAIADYEFVPHFQPKCDLATGAVCGFEVLSRWEHPQRGTLPPAEFLDLAEEIGCLDVIDAQVLHKGLDALRDLRAQGVEVTMAFNASASSLRQPEWVQDLSMALAMRNLKHSDIVIEVLETILIQDDQDQAVRSIRALTAAGTRVDIDDFGTGYASMSMLATLDVGGLKIDRSLVTNISQARDRQVVEAIIGLSHGLGIKITAEGVERPDQLAILRDLGCDTIQGFGIARPMPLTDMRDWLAERAESSVTLLEAG